MNRKVKIPEGLDTHALTAWWYMSETAKACRDAIKDYEFASLLLHLYAQYPKEYEFFLMLESGNV